MTYLVNNILLNTHGLIFFLGIDDYYNELLKAVNNQTATAS